MTFQLTPTWYCFKAYRLLSPSRRLLLPCQRAFYSIHITFISQRCIFVILVMLPRIKVNWDSRDGAVARALAFHHCVPGSIPGAGVICGLSLLLVLYSAPRGFSPGTPVFLFPQKPTFTNFISILECRGISNEFLWTLGAPWVNKLQLHLHLHLNLHLQWKETSSQSKFWLQTWSVRSV